MFVVDTCLDEDELVHLRDALQQTLNLLPEDALVGLVTFGTLVQVHELGFSDCPKAYVFRGEKEYSSQKVQDMLGISPSNRGGPGSVPGGMGGGGGRQPALGKFLLPVGECTFALEQVLEDLQRDPWPCQPDERVQRCTGTAVSVAISLLEAAMPVPKQGSRVMLFIAGPPTVGAGAIVGRSKKESIRSHLDLQKGQVPMYKPSMDFFKCLSDRCINNSIVVDVFACSLDQVGTLEIRGLVARSGGLVVLADKFGQSVFRESLRRAFERSPADSNPSIDPAAEIGGAESSNNGNNSSNQLQMGFGGHIEVIHSREFKIAGAIGPVASMKKAGPGVAETEVGVG